jgi:membrane protease YdiL (CAAX protease family)
MENRPPNPYVDVMPDMPPALEHPTPGQPVQRVWKWLDILLITLASVVTFVIGTVIITFAFILKSQGDVSAVTGSFSSLAFLNLSLALPVTVLCGCVYFLGILRKRLSWQAFGFRPLSRSWLLGASGIGIGVALLLLLIAWVLTTFLQLPDNAQLDLIGTTGLTWTGIAMMGALVIVGAPLADEMYLRGVLYTFLRERWGIWVALVVSALVQGVVTLDIVGGIVAFILGLCTGFVYERSKSLWASIIVYGMFGLAYFITFLLSSQLANIPLA